MPIFPPSPAQRRQPYGAPVPPVGPSRAPTASPVAGNGMFGGMNDWMQQNPGALGQFGAGLLQAGNSRMAPAMAEANKLQMFNQQRNATAQYLISHGLADNEEEAMMLAANPTLMSTLLKDNSIQDQFKARLAIADELGIQGEDRNRYAATGTWDSTPGQSPTTMTPAQREVLADQYHLEGAERRRFILTGSLDSANSRGLSSTQEKMRGTAEDSLPGIDYTLSQLDEASKLLESGKVATGFGTDLWSRGTVGTNGWLPGMDIESAQATKRYNDILSESAIKAMAQTLTGASTNYEMQQFLAILADPASDATIRKKALKNLKQLVTDERDTRKARIKRFSDQEDGTTFDTPLDTAPGGGGGVIDFNDWMNQKP